MDVMNNHPEYWPMVKRSHGLIRDWKNAYAKAKTSQQYIAGQWDEENECYEAVENIGPWDCVAKIENEIRKSDFAMGIAKSQNLPIYPNVEAS